MKKILAVALAGAAMSAAVVAPASAASAQGVRCKANVPAGTLAAAAKKSYC
ncbi:hypothetical protein [Streptomyces sp. cmx-18-6]|uniref:hypothetical protein n=1 Tax=Streptomyces sp. cmx-18-6 TaxID=2790930 RepID=UPI00397F9267